MRSNTPQTEFQQFNNSMFEFIKCTLALAADTSIFEFEKPCVSSPSLDTLAPAADMSIFEFMKPSVSSPILDTSIFHFTKPSLSSPAPNSNIFEFDKPHKSSVASGSNTSNLASVSLFQPLASTPVSSSVLTSASDHFNFDVTVPNHTSEVDKSFFSFQPSMSATNAGSGPRLETPDPAEVTLVVQPTSTGQATASVPAPIFIHTVPRSTPRGPRPTQLVDLDPNSARARGLLWKFNVCAWWDNADVNCSVGDMVEAFTKLWERIADPDPSPDPVVRNLQATMDKQFSKELTGDDAMDSLYGTIHQEALRSLPENIMTTSHYRYILTRMRRDKERLLEQIQTDQDILAAMDATLLALKPFVDKG